jgi:lysophospholipase L1-like esterase
MTRHVLSILLAFSLGPPVVAAQEAPVIHMIGDSTMADKERLDFPERGWGQLFREFVIAPATVNNQARNGRSTQSFIHERRWDHTLASIKPGDWVIIQFGHNDQKVENPKGYADPDGSYRENLRRFVRDARAKSAHPVIATSVVRRRWAKDGTFQDTLGAYPAAARAVAAEEKVPLLELHGLTMKMETDAGPEGSKRFHFDKDDTHFSETGARAVAQLAATEIHRLKLPLARWVHANPH